MNLEEIKNFLIQAEKKDKLHTSYLIYGGSEEEREEIGYFFAMLLNCEKDKKPCFECISCQHIKKNIHPDVKWINPTKKFLSIDDVRMVKEEIYLKPFTSDKKIYIFKIDYMKEEAANSFLKILEEPPLYGFLVILSSHINFLPTIISRCQRLKINFKLPQYDKEMENSQNEFYNLLSYLKENNFQLFFNEINNMTKNMEREEIEKWVEQNVWLYRDIFLKNNNFSEEFLVNPNVIPRYKEKIEIENIEKILELKRRIKFNINLKIAIEYLLISLF